MKVSIIVPVYNVYDYLDNCLKSLVNQSLKDIEIIVVDDGSTDDSYEIIKKYQKKYKNIKVYRKDNSGLSDTRNFGLKNASGEYIAFVDSDDYVELNMYEKMYEKAKMGNFDIVACDINYVYPNYEKVIRVDPKKDTQNNRELYINIYPTVCTKIFKRELLLKSKQLFKSGVWYEDVEFMYRLLPYITKIGVIQEPFYNYVQREKSITNTVSPKFYDYINNFNGIVDYYKKNKFYDDYYQELEYAYVRYVYATFIKTCLAYDKNDFLKAVDVAINNVREYFPHYRRNKYFYKNKKGLYLVMFNKTIAKILYRLRGKKNEK